MNKSDQTIFNVDIIKKPFTCQHVYLYLLSILNIFHMHDCL